MYDSKMGMRDEIPPLYWRSSFFNQFKSRFLLSEGEITRTWWSLLDGKLVSGFHGPFGGFQANKVFLDRISKEEIQSNLSNLRGKLPIDSGEVILRVRTYPESAFQHWSPEQEISLQQIGFRELYRDIGHHILIQGDIKKNWNRNRVREFNKTEELLDFEEVITQEHKSKLFQILNDNAISKGRLFPLTELMFQGMCDSLSSNELNLFLCFHKKNRSVVAAAICQIIDGTSVYVYRWAGSVMTEHNLRHSPITYLAHRIYSYYQDLQKEVIYLGTSSVNGVINTGLAAFKESLGAKVSSSGVYEYNFINLPR